MPAFRKKAFRRFELRYATVKVAVTGRRIRSHYDYMSGLRRGGASGLREAGSTYRRIAQHFGRSDAAIRRCWREWVLTGRGQQQEDSGRRTHHATIAVTAPDSSLPTIRRVTNTAVTTRTISRRLRERKPQSRSPLRCLPLGTTHHRQRLQWCRD